MTGQIGIRPTTRVDGTRLDIPQPEGLRFPSQEELLQRLKNDILRNPPLPASRWRRAAAGLIDMTLFGLVWKGLAAFLAAPGRRGSASSSGTWSASRRSW